MGLEQDYRNILAQYPNQWPVGGRPILEHIIKIYSKYGHKDFYIALGYKENITKKYFKKKFKNIKINLIETGINTYTGGRVLRLKKILKK